MSVKNQNLQSSSTAYIDQGLTVSYSAPVNAQLSVQSVNAYNAIAGLNSIGIFHSVNNNQFKMFSIASSVQANITAAIQAGTSTTVVTTTNNDGYLVQSTNKFNMIAFNISQASTGSPVFTYKYYNGSSYQTLTLLNTPVYSATGIQVIVFNAPIDWAIGDSGAGADATLYSIQVIATTAPGTAIKLNSLKVGKMLKYAEAAPQGSSVSLDFEDQPYLLQAGETIIPFFSYSNASNRLEITYKISG